MAKNISSMLGELKGPVLSAEVSTFFEDGQIFQEFTKYNRSGDLKFPLKDEDILQLALNYSASSVNPTYPVSIYQR